MAEDNYLISGLPTGIKIFDYFLEFNTDFKFWIKYEELMMSKKKSQKEILINIINLCLKDGLDVINFLDLKSIFNQILWFYTLGGFDSKKDSIKTEKEEEKDVVSKQSAMIYSYNFDWAYIYAAFMQCYGIDLFNTNLHWWKFKALFNGLSEDTQFSKILGYRSITITSKMSKEEKKYYQNMKRIYGLPDMRSEEEKEASFARSMFASMND